MKEFFARLVGSKSSPIGQHENVERIGSHTIVRKIGSGGTSDVFLGLHVNSMRTAAIKRMALKRSASVHHEMFATESLLCGTLDHPNIVSVYSANLEDTGGAYLIMEYIDGNSLDRFDQIGTLLPIDTVVDVMRQSAEALRYLAAENIIHRDLKPGNILLRRDGRAKIADFGCAIINGRNAAALRVAGSLPYMAPEQVEGRPLSTLSDMYSLGAVFYRLLTGHYPFAMDEDMAPQAYAERILGTDPIPVEERRAEIPCSIGRVVARALQKKPQDRYESWEKFLRALQVASAGRYEEDEALSARWQSVEIYRQKQLVLRDCDLSFGL